MPTIPSPLRALPTITLTPTLASAIAAQVHFFTRSPSISQLSNAAIKGDELSKKVTLATLVCHKAKMLLKNEAPIKMPATMLSLLMRFSDVIRSPLLRYAITINIVITRPIEL